MDKHLLKAATDGDSTSMKHYACHNPGILLGKTLRLNTCLHISSMHGHQRFSEDVVALEESLLTAVNLDWETPLLVAVRNGHVSLASFLLGSCHKPRMRQSILKQDKYGFNVLHHAIRNGHEELALELIIAEPSLSRAFKILLLLIREDYTVAIAYMLQSEMGIQSCLDNLSSEIAKQILENYPGLMITEDINKVTPTRHAVLFGKIDMLRVILLHDPTKGYEINSMGDPLLAAAAYRGRINSARELLEHCPDAPYRQENGGTLLHRAVWDNQIKFVKFVLTTPLLRKLINMQDKTGKTALHYAVRKCDPELVSILLSHEDIDVTVVDNDGVSAAWQLKYVMENAKTLNWNEVLMLMLKADAQNATSLYNLHGKAKQEAVDAGRKDAKSLTKTYTTNISLVAILITTITFAAAFTLPGGYSSVDGSEGLPIMSRKVAFQAFLISDTLAMCSSFAVAFICVIARWEDYEFLIYYTSFTKKLMWFAYVATTTAFSTALYTVLASRLHWLATAISVLVALLPILTKLLGEWPVLKLRFRLGKTFNSDLLDMV
ncbi:ankyrin repeat-containing protein [Hordeum vulgare]|nr:ankyrin repeat-containing protein [Hordeum vulgare]